MSHFFRRSHVNIRGLQNQAPRILALISPAVYRRFSSVAASTMHNVESVHARRTWALQKYGLQNFSGLRWPGLASTAAEVDYRTANPNSIRQMYDETDLAKLPIFQGGFINFGYWPNPLPDDYISIEKRIDYSREMYRMIGDLFGRLREKNILEVGVGQGHGSAFFSRQYHTKFIVGLDISSAQVARAKAGYAQEIKAGKLRFTIGEAESMPFTDAVFDGVISIEAAQHFTSITDFAKETARVLKPGGKLVVTSFFPTCVEGVEAVNAIVPDYHIHGSQNTTADVVGALSQYLERVEVKSVGANVWHGFSRWLDQIGYSDQWSKIWPALYEKGLVDYVVYTAQSPQPVPVPNHAVLHFR